MLKICSINVRKLWSDLRKCFTLRLILTGTLTHQGISLPILVRPLLLTAYPIRGSVMASQARPRKRMMDAEKGSIYEKLISHKILTIWHYYNITFFIIKQQCSKNHFCNYKTMFYQIVKVHDILTFTESFTYFVFYFLC